MQVTVKPQAKIIYLVLQKILPLPPPTLQTLSIEQDLFLSSRDFYPTIILSARTTK